MGVEGMRVWNLDVALSQLRAPLSATAEFISQKVLTESILAQICQLILCYYSWVAEQVPKGNSQLASNCPNSKTPENLRSLWRSSARRDAALLTPCVMWW